MQVQTVLGPVDPAQLGRTLTHEHFSLDFNHFYTVPPKQIKPLIDTQKIQLSNVGFVRQHPYGSKYNVQFNDVDTHQSVIEDVLLFKKWGGGTIVENTTHGLIRDLNFIHKVAVETDVHIVAGTGHYINALQSNSTLAMTTENLVNLYTQEIVDGIVLADLNTVVKCGIIGEVGSVWPIRDFEKRSIQATGLVQEILGCGVSFHPGRDQKAPFEIVRIYLEAGGRADKCVMSHLDRTIMNSEKLLEFAKLGVYCQFDLFGTECSHYQLNSKFDMPSDAQRIKFIADLVAAGFEDRILISHDVHTKHRLINFGGHGYSHILNHIVPKMLDRGLTTEHVDKITIENPSQWLQFNTK